jgi:hypothetical protein
MFNLALQAGKLIQKPYIPMLRENNVMRQDDRFGVL